MARRPPTTLRPSPARQREAPRPTYTAANAAHRREGRRTSPTFAYAVCPTAQAVSGGRISERRLGSRAEIILRGGLAAPRERRAKG